MAKRCITCKWTDTTTDRCVLPGGACGRDYDYVAWAPIQSDVRTVEVKPKSDPKELAYAHWGYVRELLEAHEETDAVIERCGFHYVSAFLHGYKHALEDIGHGSPDA